ncbi:15457_t:CDS:2, partial [Funneliformis caledonium]
SKGLDGRFVNRLERYMVEPKVFKIFHYGFYKKQLSLFLQDLQVNDYAVICSKCIFNIKDMHILISAAFKIEDSGFYNKIKL